MNVVRSDVSMNEGNSRWMSSPPGGDSALEPSLGGLLGLGDGGHDSREDSDDESE